eukprot:Rhum_TRINITY_DN15097_c2_g1::Rhum_TRINITY_DN15097_c2_g1_i1::g.133195::m.133195
MKAARFGIQLRAISGVAPVLHFPASAPEGNSKADNTTKALEMIRAQLGEKPAAYTRKYDVSFEEIKAEIDSVLASCGSDEAPLEEGAEVTQMQVIERVLRHGLCSYQKNEGTCSVEDMEKWLVYTAQDQMELNKLKRDAELQAKYANFGSDAAASVPQFNWAAEYSAAVDREVVAEKRLRYERVAATSFARDEEAIEAELQEYKGPVQAQALDTLVEQLNLFKPFLAKQVVQAKLIETNAEGQLTYSRFSDFNPDARDLADLHASATIHTPGSAEDYLPLDEADKRYADVRMKTKEEVISAMEAAQSAASSSSSGGGGAMGADDARRAKLIADLARLQARGGDVAESKEVAGMSEEEKEAAAEAARVAHQKEMEKYKVGDSVVASKGLLGLNFLKEAASA